MCSVRAGAPRACDRYVRGDRDVADASATIRSASSRLARDLRGSSSQHAVFVDEHAAPVGHERDGMVQQLVEYVDRVERADHQSRRLRQELECLARSALTIEQLGTVERERALIGRSQQLRKLLPVDVALVGETDRETADDLVARLKRQND